MLEMILIYMPKKYYMNFVTFEILRYNIYVESNDAILRSDFMATATGNPVMERENTDEIKLELYRLIGEGYKAMQEGMVSAIDDVCERIKKRRAERD